MSWTAARAGVVAATVVALGCALGSLATLEPRLGRLVLIGVLLFAAAAIRTTLFTWDLLAITFGGLLLFGYGFANVGFHFGGFPLPLADLVAVVLLLVAATTPKFGWPWSAPFVLSPLLFGLASVRLAFDYPVWGTNAVRDFTLPAELAFLFIGFWALRRYGVERWVRTVRWLFVACLLYFALYPWRDLLAAAGPVVGLQRPVPLLGTYAGAGTAAAAGFFFFALLRPFGTRSYLLASGFLPELAFFQSRGLYIAVPGTALLVSLFASGRLARAVRRSLLASVLVGAVGLAVAFAYSPQGRLGPISPGFAESQLRTVVGAPGPGAGSRDERVKWIGQVIAKVRATPKGWVIGVGLGPDLAGGFRNELSTLVRKPHDDYLEVFARLGLVGLTLFVGILATTLWSLLGAARRAAGVEARFLWWTIAVALVYLGIAGTQPLLAFPYGTVPLFLVMGAGLAIADQLHAASQRGALSLSPSRMPMQILTLRLRHQSNRASDDDRMVENGRTA